MKLNFIVANDYVCVRARAADYDCSWQVSSVDTAPQSLRANADQLLRKAQRLEAMALRMLDAAKQLEL